MSQETKKLFTEFPPVSTEQWEEVINADLKGADYEKKLIWKTNEGFNVKPYYRAEDLKNLGHLDVNPSEYPFVRGNKKDNNDWEICQEIDVDDPVEANKVALEAIERGATAIGLRVNTLQTNAEMTALFKGIDLRKVRINFIAANSYPLVYDYYMQELVRQGIEPSEAKGSFNFDCLAYLLLKGDFYLTKDNNFVEAAQLISRVKKSELNFKTININGSIFNNSGSSIVQELAFALASGNEYIVELINKGISIDDVCQRLQFTFAIGGNYFMEIAKIRAARMLWARIVEQYKPVSKDSMKMYVHSVTSTWNKSVYDPYVNMLRSTTEAMSAALGGCDSMTVAPFDATYKEADTFSRRIARNTQIILKEESYFNKIVDPAAGSYYIETLTDSIANEAWKLFQEVENKGGFIEAVKAGFIQDEIAKAAQQRDMSLATRKEILLGINQYPNSNERMIDKITVKEEAPAKEGTYKTLKPYRGAEAFEQLRLNTEAFAAKAGFTPKVFLLTMGNLAMRKARSMFSGNFFGCTGFEIIDSNGFNSVEEAVNAALEAKANITVICSSDEEYAEIAAPITSQLKAKDGNMKVVVAGNPTDIMEQLKSAGVDDFISVRSNVLETLKKFQASILK